MNRHRQRGLTLIELMIAGTLGLVLVIALAQLFIDNNRNRRQNQQLAGLQDQGRYALSVLSRDLAMAGYWGNVYQGQMLTIANSASDSLDDANDCGPADASGWAFAAGRRVEFLDDASGVAASTRFRCLSDTRPDTDVVAIRRVSGQAAAQFETCANANLTPFEVYLKTNGVIGSLLRVGGTGMLDTCVLDAPLQPPMQFYRYLLRIYHIRDWARSPDDGIPTLCRMSLSRTVSGGFVEDCMAEGIEDLQVVWGLDLDNDLLRTPDRYTTQPSEADLDRAVTAQIFLRARATEADFSHSDVKTYAYADRVGGRVYIPRNADAEANGVSPRHYYRRVFSTTVQLRNPLP